MREDTNFKGSDSSCPSIYFLFYGLAKHGIMQSRESFSNLMDDVGGDLKNKVKQLVKTERKPQIVFDNFDFKILANII